MTKKIFNFQFSIFNLKPTRGFTLVELLIAISLFIVVVTISIGAVLSIFDANRKAQSTKTVVDNLNYSIENMARVVRFGDNYHCGTGGTLSNPQNCPDNVEGNTFLAVTFNGTTIAYRLNGTAIQRSDNPSGGESTYKNITSSETVVERLRFYVFGATDSPSLEQPYIIVVIKGYVGSKPTFQTSFSVETLMSQRALDL